MVDWTYLVLLKQGRSAWNRWRQDNLEASLDFSGANLSGINLSGANLSNVSFSNTNLSGANLSGANLSGANLGEANLNGANLNGANLNGANLNNADFTAVQAIGTDFINAIFTGVCIQDWNTNSATNLDGVMCEYVYRKQNQQERCPPISNFALGEFTKLFQKVLSTVDLIFRNGVDWSAFAYSFKKVESINEDGQFSIRSIENTGDGIVIVRVNVSPSADKVRIHNEFMQGYQLAQKSIDDKYKERLEDKDKFINDIINQKD
jgi:hypothetical protein